MELFRLSLFSLLLQLCLIKCQSIEDVINILEEAYEEIYDNNETLLEDIDFIQENYDDTAKNIEVFDFVIVGAGTAGSVLANRLSEVRQWKILVLEAGDVPPVLNDLGFLQEAYALTNLSWNILYEAEPQAGHGIIEGKMNCPVGKTLGGSSSRNNMVAVRGNKFDYGKWEAMGNPGWGYEDVLPYFKKLETANVLQQDNTFRGTSGPVNINNLQFTFGTVDKFIRGYQELGLKYLDYNGESQLGVSDVQVTQRHGLRCSGEKAYLREAKRRKNLKILTRSTVVKIHIFKKLKRANGVKYYRDGKYYNAFAKKEIIISAGAMNSPKLLMLSGIGPKNQLENFGIDVIQDSPVGEVFYDHIAFFGLALEFDANLFPQPDYAKELKKLVEGGESVLSNIILEALAFQNTGVDPNRHPDNPDVEIILAGGGFPPGSAEILSAVYRIKDDIRDNWFKDLETRRSWIIFPMLASPESVGHVELRSKDPFDQLKIYGNFLSSKRDVDALIIAIKSAINLTQTQVGIEMGLQLYNKSIPGCENYVFNSDYYWECAVRSLSPTVHHQTATVKMGPLGDPKAVVDNGGKVYGVNRLRVADASIIPLSPVCHTSVPAYMIGEKISDMIKEDWLPKPLI